jgi:hypothetical protein
MTRQLAIAVSLATLAVAGCAPMNDDSGSNLRAPAATKIGETVSCIPRQDIDNFSVRDDYTIDFRMRDGSVYRNTLPGRCPTLGREGRLNYEATNARICSADNFQVQNPAGRTTVPCSFGEFTPVRLSGN